MTWGAADIAQGDRGGLRENLELFEHMATEMFESWLRWEETIFPPLHRVEPERRALARDEFTAADQRRRDLYGRATRSTDINERAHFQ